MSLAKWLGDCGKIRFEFVLTDGRRGTGKMDIESFNNSIEEVEEYVSKALFVEEGYTCKSIKIIGFVEL